MADVLWWIAAALGVVSAGVIALLVTPVMLGVTVRTAPTWRVRIVMRLLGGLTPDIPLHDSTRARREPDAKKPEAGLRRPRKRREAKGGPRITASRILRAVTAAPRLLADLLRPIQIERLRIDADVGFSDPADTGQLFGAIAAARYSGLVPVGSSVAIRPDFTGARLSGDCEARVSFVPAAFVPPGVRFAWHVFGPTRDD